MSGAVNAVSNLFGNGNQAGTPGSDASKDYTNEYNNATGDVKNLYQPYTTAGSSALTSLLGKAQGGFSLSDFQADPGYQFQLQQGMRATQQQAGVTGSAFGGNTLEALDQYSQGLAATTYQNAFNRWQTQVQNLAGVAGIGANAAGAEGGNLASLFGGMTGAQSTVTGANIARGGSVAGLGSNLLSI